MDLAELTIRKAHEGLMKKEFSAKELCQAFLSNIEEKNKDIFAYLTVSKEEAIKQAEKVDKLISREKEIPLLAGIPMAIKDNILVEDVKCTAGSKILENYIAPYDATVIKRLREQRAVILGKTNLDEFAMGASCEYSAFGPTKNPHNLERVPGGSSGGSAAAVAGNMALASLGSDTCGSVRFPASFCGVVGLRPTYGNVSRYGLIAMASSFDQIGPIAKCVEDVKIVFDAISEQDPLDSTSIKLNSKSQIPNSKQIPNGAQLKAGRVAGGLESKFQIQDLRIGVPKEYFIEGMDSEVERLVKTAIKKFEDLGAKIEEISLPHTKYALPAYYIVMPSEVSANLARYDGIKYGMSKIKNQKPKTQKLLDVYLKTRKEGFGNEVKRRIVLGTFALSHGYYEAYYLRAQKARTKVKEDFERVFREIDLILTPVSPIVPFKIGEKTQDPLQMYLVDIFMAPTAISGLPAVSVPCGKVDGLPVGLQIIGNVFKEDKILKAGEIFEKFYAIL